MRNIVKDVASLVEALENIANFKNTRSASQDRVTLKDMAGDALRDLGQSHNPAGIIPPKYKVIRASELEVELVRILEGNLGIEKERILLSSHIIDNLGADSLDGVELIVALEEEFNVEINDKEAEKINTVQDAFNLLVKKGVEPRYFIDPRNRQKGYNPNGENKAKVQSKRAKKTA